MAKVYVGLSGGVDSSVSAALLVRAGHEVVGVYMKNWTQDIAGVACPWQRDLSDARAAAAVLDIPFRVFDFQDSYRERVVEVMVAEYAAGRTPNPDVLCNQEIKFKLFLAAARADGADMIATGHYAGTRGNRLLRARDEAKDQTYFLYRMTREAVEQTIFPLAELTKPEVRHLAARFGLATATKPDSQGICFVGEVGIKSFLEQYLTPTPGPILERATGRQLGIHTGAAFYTIGQRHGLGIGGGTPYYVAAKDMATQTLYVTADAFELERDGDEFEITDPHWITTPPIASEKYEVRIRHRGALMSGTVTQTTHDTWQVKLATPASALAAGQSAVIYHQDEVIGGGFIVI